MLCLVPGALCLVDWLTSTKKSLCTAVVVKRRPLSVAPCCCSTDLTWSSLKPCAAPHVAMRLFRLSRPSESVIMPTGRALGYLPKAAICLEIWSADSLGGLGLCASCHRGAPIWKNGALWLCVAGWLVAQGSHGSFSDPGIDIHWGCSRDRLKNLQRHCDAETVQRLSRHGYPNVPVCCDEPIDGVLHCLAEHRAVCCCLCGLCPMLCHGQLISC